MKKLKLGDLRNFFFVATLAVLPFNTRHVLNYEAIKDLEGFREHISISIYAFDIMIAAFLATSFLIFFFEKEKFFGSPFQKTKKILWNPFFWFAFFVGISIFLSAYPKISLYNGGRLLFSFLFFVVASRSVLRSQKTLSLALLVIFLGGMFQSLVAIAQFSLQKSLGLWILGESVISPHILGVSKFEFAQTKFVRSYGTFPHPNLLSAFLLLALSCGFNFLFQGKKKGGRIAGMATASGIILIATGILLTYSRAAIAAMAIVLLFMAIGNKNWLASKYSELCEKIFVNKIFRGTLAIFIIFALLFGIYNLLLPRMCLKNCPRDNSVALRIIYNKEALGIVSQKPIFGVGPGTFTEYSREHLRPDLQIWEFQPVHNLFLLISSEIGLFGLASFLLVISWKARNKNSWKCYLADPLTLVFAAFLGLAMVDHYFWTIAQGQHIFWLSLAFFSRPR